jgi:hypothetical protein
MSLAIGRTTSGRFRVIATLIAVFAFIVQPYAGIAFGEVAHAAPVTYTVCETTGPGCAYDSLQNAINAAQSGDTVSVAAGTYNATQFLVLAAQHGVTIQGAGVNQTIFNLTAVSDGFKVQANDVTLKDFTITSNAHVANYGLRAQGVSNLTVDAVAVTNMVKTGFDINGVTHSQFSNIKALNNGGAGIYATDSQFLTFTNTTTSGNAWGAIGLDAKGSTYACGTNNIVFNGMLNLSEATALYAETDTPANPACRVTNVTVPAGVLPYKVTPSKLVIKDVFVRSLADASAIASSPASNGPVAVTTVDNSYVVSTKFALQDALNAAPAASTLNVIEDLTANAQTNISKPVTIAGNGHSITASSLIPNNMAVLAPTAANGVIISDLTIDGNAVAKLHGINAFKSTISLDGVTLKNNTKYGLVVNSSQLTVNNITTVNNAWGGIDVDQKTSSSSAPAKLTVNGHSTHNETGADIYVDDTTHLVSVMDTNNQYNMLHAVVLPNDTVYKLKPADVTAPTVPTNGQPRDGAYKSTNDFYFTWDGSTDDSAGTVTYEFQSDNNAGFTNPWDSITNGNSEQNNLITPTIHSTGAPDGHYFWRVRAIDAAGNKSAWSTVWDMNINTAVPAAPTAVKWLNHSGTTLGAFTNVNLVTPAWAAPVSGNVDHYDYSYQSPTAGWSSPAVFTATSIPDQSFYGAGNNGTEGVWQYRVRSVSPSGLTSNWVESPTLTYDKTKPSVTVTPTDLSVPLAVGPTITVTATDAGSGLGALVIHIYNSSNTLLSTCGSATVAQLAAGTMSCNTSGLPDGTYTIKAGATDKATNNQTVVKTFTIAGTPEIPTAVFTANNTGTNVANGGVTNSQNFTFNLTASGVTRYQLKYWNTIPGSSFNGEANAWNPSDISSYSSSLGVYNDQFTQGEGTHYFAFSACNAVGNCSAYSAPFVVTLDQTGPNVVVTNQVRNANGTYTINGTTDDLSNPVVVAVDGDDVNPVTMDGYNWSALTGVLTDGPHVVTATGSDTAGNVTFAMNDFTATTPVVTPGDGNTEGTDTPLTGPTTNNTVTLGTLVVGGSSLARFATLNTGTANNAATDSTSADTPEVLGTETNKDSGKVLEQTAKTAATATGAKGWEIIGFAWYWWLLALAAIAGIWWIIAAAKRRAQDA